MSDRSTENDQNGDAMKFRKKPVEIEAMLISADSGNVQADGSESFLDPNREAIAKASGWMLGHGFRDFKVCGDGPFGISIRTLEGDMLASPGDWIIRGVQGEFYPCKPDIFEATYEPVNPPDEHRPNACCDYHRHVADGCCHCERGESHG